MSTYTPIASQTLTSAVSSVTFSGIPQAYTDLVIVVTGTVASIVNPRMRFNSDAGNNYSVTWLSSDGTSVYSGRQTNQPQMLWGAYSTGTTITTATINILNYSNNTTFKSFLSRNASNISSSGQAQSVWTGTWRNTAAITSIELSTPSGQEWQSGTIFSLYGIDASLSAQAKATGGSSIYTDGTYWYHTFTSSGTFTPSQTLSNVDYLIVAGGGGRANATGSGGGGGGGLRYGNTGVTPGPYSIVVGGGGPSAFPGLTNRSGSPSSAFGITATGGGGGGYDPAGAAPAQPGGSGGGGGTAPFPPGNAGAAGLASPITIPYQGYDGTPAGFPAFGGHGGGAGGKGGPFGGPGRILSQFPAPIVKSGVPDPTFGPLVESLGYAAGGHGFPTPAPLSRTSPTGSGFGGTNTGYTGGSGIVCIRYRKVPAYTRATGGTVEPSTHPEHPGVWRHIFTSPGTFEVTDPSLEWIEYFAVGGGGGGGGSAGPPATFGGGGGGGGFVSSIQNSPTTPLSIPEAYPWNPGYSVRAGEQMPVGLTTYPITIGNGGSSGTAGSNTTIGNPGASQIIAYGGGAGGSAPGNGGNGGSGGGGAKPAPSAGALIGGTATPTPLIQGNDGGTSSSLTWPAVAAAAGGGGALGSPVSGPLVAIGGTGWYSVLSPSSYGTPGPVVGYRYFAGGGGGHLPPLGAPGVVGGAGGGGNGRGPTVGVGNSGTVNTGGGGGGGNNNIGGTGGPGIVIIQYPE